MNRDEAKADLFLIDAKIGVRRALTVLDPNPREPVATAILKALDTIESARGELRKRGPGRETRSALESADPKPKRAAND